MPPTPAFQVMYPNDPRTLKYQASPAGQTPAAKAALVAAGGNPNAATLGNAVAFNPANFGKYGGGKKAGGGGMSDGGVLNTLSMLNSRPMLMAETARKTLLGQ